MEEQYPTIEPKKEELRRALGPFLIFALSFGSIMGTGMFFGAAIGAQWGGAASVLAWPILLPITLYIAACFSELSSMFPKAGGIYEFAKQAYGRFPSFCVGWLGWIAGNFSNTVVVVAGVSYLLPQADFGLYRVIFSILIIILLNFIAFFWSRGEWDYRLSTRGTHYCHSAWYHHFWYL